MSPPETNPEDFYCKSIYKIIIKIFGKKGSFLLGRDCGDGRRKIRGDRPDGRCDRASKGGIYEEAGGKFYIGIENAAREKFPVPFLCNRKFRTIPCYTKRH